MRFLKLFVNCLLLITMPTLVLYPQVEVPALIVKTAYSSLSYDAILNLLEELENGELENSTPEKIEKINHFLIRLAKEGSNANNVYDAFILEEDIQELLDEENPYEYAFSYGKNDYVIGDFFCQREKVILCKSWLSKQLDKIAKFIKKHKKEIIIGTAVVVATVAVVGIVAAATTGVAAAAAASSGSEEKSSTPDTNSVSPMDPPLSGSDATLLKEVLDEHIAEFKQQVLENGMMQMPDDPSNEEAHSFIDTARELGSGLAHEALNGVSVLLGTVPQLGEEIKDIGDKLLPEWLNIGQENSQATPKQNYEKTIAAGHSKIDEFFSTELAECFSPETMEIKDNKFTIGIIPPPGVFGINVSELLEAGKVLDRAELTRAGRALMKHGYRQNSVFPKPVGNPTQVNNHGQIILEQILTDPKKEVIKTAEGGIKIYAPNGMGAEFKKDGTFKGFIERQYE